MRKGQSKEQDAAAAIADAARIEIAKLELGPGDILIVKLDINRYQLADVDAALKLVLPKGVRWMAMPKDIEVSVLAKKESAAAHG